MSRDVFLETHSRDIFGDILWINVMYINVRRLFSGDTLWTYFQRYAPDQCCDDSLLTGSESDDDKDNNEDRGYDKEQLGKNRG